MNGTRLGRGRGGRLAVYVGCGMVVILLVFLYRAATSEMARLQELNVQCSHQQEALAAQLQGIYIYILLDFVKKFRSEFREIQNLL